MSARDAAAISIRRYRGASDCDVVVALRGQEMVLHCPNDHQAVKWARIECKSYKVPFSSLDEGDAYLPTKAPRNSRWSWVPAINKPELIAADGNLPSSVAHSTH
jgi:hypothetical protein